MIWPDLVEILLVEDSLSDIRLTLEALKTAKIRNRVSVVRNGVEALAFLRQEGDYVQAPRPGLVLLDLNLPKKGGREVLAEVKADPVLRRIPVVVLTSSSEEEDVLKSYDLHANGYITKPINVENFMNIVSSVEWFFPEIITLPSTMTQISENEDPIRCLLIEDSPLDARLVREMLAKAGGIPVALVHVERLDEAFQRLGAERFDVALLDLNLRETQGMDTLHRIRSFAPGMPIVVLTVLGDEVTGVQAIREGAQEYLAKGFGNPQVLTRALRYAIERKRMEEERETLIRQLEEALAHVKALRELLPICAGCKKIRNDKGYWMQVEEYFSANSNIEFSHGLCHECAVTYGWKRVPPRQDLL